MAFINGNQPITTNGLIYAADFGNTKTYITGTNFNSLVFPNITASIYSGAGVQSSSLYLTGSNGTVTLPGTTLSVLKSTGSFTIQWVGLPKDNTPKFFLNQELSNAELLYTKLSTGSIALSLFNKPASGFNGRLFNYNQTSRNLYTWVYDQGSHLFYVNGFPVTASSHTVSTGSNDSGTNNFFSYSGVFADLSGSTVYQNTQWSGSLDQIYIYSRALNYTEVYQNYVVASSRYKLPLTPKLIVDPSTYLYVNTANISDSITISALNTFITGLKTNNIWNKIAIAYPLLGLVSASQIVNLKDAGVFNLQFNNSWSFSNSGSTPANSGSFITSLFTPISTDSVSHPNLISTNSHFTYLSYDLPTTSSNLFGATRPATVSGGQIFYSGSKAYHVFTASGNFLVDTAISASMLIVAGGGGGNSVVSAGGGGAGGLITSSVVITPGSYPVIVGQGGLGAANRNSILYNGQNSTLLNYIAYGGGKGGSNYSIYAANGYSGGSGGGGAISGSGIAGQGNAGASSYGGGGGASTTGSGINGGSGSYLPEYVTVGPGYGVPLGWFAGGGGAGVNVGGTYGTGGIGGGGSGSDGNTVAQSGSSNTGGGGGGAGYNNGDRPGGSGGSGIIIISYNTSSLLTLTSSFTAFLSDTVLSGSHNSTTSSATTASGNIGLITLSRTGSGTSQLYKNTTLISTISTASATPVSPMYINAVNINTTASGISPYSVSYLSFGLGLNTSELSTYHNLVGQLQTNLKRKNTLLDNYTGAAAAYSLRRIGPSGYFGPAIRVRRDSDNTLRDIGFTSDGQLDTVGLLDFVGVTGSGFVNTWYDQSGNEYNAIQATSANQPLVIGSGSVYTDTNKPAIYFDNNDNLITAGYTQTMDYLSAYILARPLIDSDSSYGWWRIGGFDQSEYKFFIGYNTQVGQSFYNKGGGASNILNAIQAGKKQLLTIDADNDGFTIYDNNILSQTITKSGTLGGGTQIRLGTTIYHNSPVIFQENIIYPASKKTTILSAVNSNILSAYTTGSDTDYQSFITATGITQPTQSAALETLVSDLKSYGLWNKMKAIYPMITDKNNRFAYSQALATTWNAVNVYVTQSFTTAPDGTLTGNFISESAVTDTHYIYQTIADGLVTGSEYVTSIYGKFLNRPWIAMETNAGAKAWFNIQTGVTGSLTGSNATITAVSGGWYRCALYFTSSVASGPQNIQYHLADANGNLSYAGVSGTGSYLWGAQFENGNLVGPYRATTTVGFTTGSMLDQMKYNLKNTGSFSGSYVGGWTPGYGGNKPNGVNGYMDTGVNSSASLNQNSAHLSYYSRTDVLESKYDIGYYNTTQTDLAIRYAGSTYGSINSSEPNFVDPNSLGFYLISRVSNNQQSLWKNNTKKATGTQTSNAPENFNIYIGAINYTGNANYFSSKQNAFATIGDGLTDYEAKALYWIVQKYQTTLGRQVY